MIPDTPAAKDLLETAAAELKAEILPAVKRENKLTVLMAIAAIETAVREQEAIVELQGEQLGAMAALASGPVASKDRAGDLCKAIRSGDFDTGDRARALYHALMDDVAARTAISNPRYLNAAEADWTGRG